VARRLVPATLRPRLRRVLFDWLDLSWTTRQRVRLRVATYNEWIIYNEIFVDGEYDPAIQLALARRASDGPLHIVDLGANVGFFTLRLFDRARAKGLDDRDCLVTLVEADPAIIPVLERRLHRDNALRDQVRIVHGAVGSQDATCAFYPSVVAPGEGSLVPSADATPVAVPAVDLDRMMADAPLIDLVKCDIEGAELSFFEQSPTLLERTRALVVEIHTDRCPVEQGRARLATAGLTREVVLRDRGGCALHLYTRE
jgi:FkbM family methyltransferase